MSGIKCISRGNVKRARQTMKNGQVTDADSPELAKSQSCLIIKPFVMFKNDNMNSERTLMTPA